MVWLSDSVRNGSLGRLSAGLGLGRKAQERTYRSDCRPDALSASFRLCAKGCSSLSERNGRRTAAIAFGRE